MPPFERWAIVVNHLFRVWGGVSVLLLSSFLLFRTKYVRYLMAFWCVCFHEGFNIGFWDVEIGEFLDGVILVLARLVFCLKKKE